MSDPVIVDSHLHLFQTAEECRVLKEDYEIWEFGKADDVRYSAYLGSIDDALEAMATAGVTKAISLNLFLGNLKREAAIAELPAGMTAGAREKAIAEIETVFVMSGEVVVYLEHYEPVVLKRGDSMYFDSTMAHACISQGPEDAKIIWVCSQSPEL